MISEALSGFNVISWLKGYIDLIGTEFDQLGSYLVKGLRHEDFILILTMDQQELEIWLQQLSNLVKQIVSVSSLT